MNTNEIENNINDNQKETNTPKMLKDKINNILFNILVHKLFLN